MTRQLLAALALCLISAPALADAGHGRELHQQHCVGCHINMTGGDGSVLYTRSDRRVRSLAGLQAQVRRCEANLELKWFDEDIEDVVEYLNQAYYRFPD